MSVLIKVDSETYNRYRKVMKEIFQYEEATEFYNSLFINWMIDYTLMHEDTRGREVSL